MSEPNESQKPKSDHQIRMIPETEIERVKRETDLLALVRSRGIEMKAHGSKDWIGLCPFHDDKSKANFIVTPGKGLFHCMMCGAAGNAIQFVARHDTVSFRHAFELLNHGGAAAFQSHRQLSSRSSVPRLACPLDPQADDATLLGQVAAYYHQRLKEMPQARAYLASRGLDHVEMIEHFQIGFADRTLGLRLPDSNRHEGELLRSRLEQLGVWRSTGREHFNGCVVAPLRDEVGKVVSFYGRRTAPQNGFTHLYPPGPHQGLFNPDALKSEEIVLCEAALDALTFWAAGFRNVTCIFGTEGFTDELWQAILRRKVRRVRLAYDADEAGERAAKRDAEKLRSHGIEVWRIKFPWGMDANEYARKVTPADKSLALIINAATWFGTGRPPAAPKAEAVASLPAVSPDMLASPKSSDTGERAGASSLVAASLAAPVPEAAEKEIEADSLPATPTPSVENISPPIVAATMVPGAPVLEPRGEAWFLELDGREYRVTGLEKANGSDSLKVTLRLRVCPGFQPSTFNSQPAVADRFHLDQVDLCRDADRRRFIERAAEETALPVELLRRDLAKLLLAAEQAQAELARPKETAAPKVTLTPEEREEALAFLKRPDLIEAIGQTFETCGLVGEEKNRLASYLACTSRKLERPLAVIVQSTSAAGKSALMEAVLAMFPEEERVKYSAMTGQSLYYLGESNLRHKILAIVEEEGAEKASYALKLLQSEGELSIASTGKDPQTGRMVTHEYRVKGPVMIFLTTTAVEIDEELQNRCLTLTVDESREQTERIHALQRQARTLEGLRRRKQREKLLKLMRNAQRLIEPLDVVNPWADRLTFTSERTRTRRDNDKYLSLIESIALLGQHQRPIETDADGGRFIRVKLEDIELANQLAPELLGRCLDELPPQTRRLLRCIQELVRGRMQARRIEQRLAFFNRRELCAVTGWSYSQIKRHLDRLQEMEYLAARFGRMGEMLRYELLIGADESEGAVHIGLLDVRHLRESQSTTETLTGLEGGLTSPCQNGWKGSDASQATTSINLSTFPVCTSGAASVPVVVGV